MFVASYSRTMAGAAQRLAERRRLEEPSLPAPEPKPAPQGTPEPEKKPDNIIPFRRKADKSAAEIMRNRGVPAWARGIALAVSEASSIPLHEIIGTSRYRKVVAARNEVFYRLKAGEGSVLGPPSYPQIAAWFAREHTGVLYGATIHAMVNDLPRLSQADITTKLARNRERAVARWRNMKPKETDHG